MALHNSPPACWGEACPASQLSSGRRIRYVPIWHGVTGIKASGEEKNQNHDQFTITFQSPEWKVLPRGSRTPSDLREWGGNETLSSCTGLPRLPLHCHKQGTFARCEEAVGLKKVWAWWHLGLSDKWQNDWILIVSQSICDQKKWWFYLLFDLG